MSSISTTVTEQLPSPSASKQPDIGYHPDYQKYLERTARRLSENPDLPNTPLPPNFPKRLEGPIVWEGNDWNSEDQWVYRLSESELREIDDALEHFKGKVIELHTLKGD
jgi:hypothetical protein